MGFISHVMSFLFACFHFLFAFLKQSLFRLKEKIKPHQRNLSSALIIQPLEEEEEEKKQTDVFFIEQKIESFFSFQFRTYEEYDGKVKENLNQMSDDEISDDDFFEAESSNGEDDETIIANFSRSSLLHVYDIEEPQVHSETVGFSADDSVNVEETDEHSPEINSDVENSQTNEENIEDENLENEEKLSDSLKNTHLFSSDDDESLVSDSDSDSMTSSLIDSIRDGFLYEIDNSMEFEGGEANSSKEFLTEEDIELENFNYKGYEADENGPNEEAILEDVIDEQNSEILNSGEELSSDSEEKNELERQREHQDLVEQLKIEIKKVKAIGVLPTILEESETPKTTEDLKPWKIEEKFQYEDTLVELHKFYKSYKERMRKLDILNYQKLHDMGFIEPKNSLESLTRNKLSKPSMTGIVSLDCLSCKGESVTQPMKMKRLNIDLEIVYVGQICLSWEFLRWEYGKALKLWDTDFLGIHRYNNVAHKFNQFQLLIKRFLEDEPIQAPRVLHYAKTRCVLGNLLQVPLIREDDLRDKNKDRKDSVTSVKLVEIIEESIRTLWKLIRTDKYTMSNTVLVKACGRSNVELQNPADGVLLEQLRSTLHKKEKRLKELRVSENCILRKIRKQKNIEDGTTDDVRHFFSQVDLKLVSRVLNMSKISTQQFSWCSHKLNKINVVAGKLYFDSSFHLFP